MSKKKYNYKEMFENLLFKDKPYEVSKYILKQMDIVPYEYCEKYVEVNNGHVNIEEAKAIVSRKDCPDETVFDFCREIYEVLMSDAQNEEQRRSRRNTASARIGKLFEARKGNGLISDECFHYVIENVGMITSLLEFDDMTDNVKRYIIGELFKEGTTMENLKNHKLDTADIYVFFKNQHSIPEDCWDVVDEFCESVSKINGRRGDIFPWKVEFLSQIRFMKPKLHDKSVESILDKMKNNYYSDTLRYKLYKACVNPSLSDYSMMQLLVKSPDELMEKVNELIGKGKQGRERFRQIHRKK